MKTTSINTDDLAAYVIRDVPSLDPITVILHDMGEGRGRLIVECFGKAWANYWGATGEKTLTEFLRRADADYITRALARNQPLPRKIAAAEDAYLRRIVNAVKESLK